MTTPEKYPTPEEGKPKFEAMIQSLDSPDLIKGDLPPDEGDPSGPGTPPPPKPPVPLKPPKQKEPKSPASGSDKDKEAHENWLREWERKKEEEEDRQLKRRGGDEGGNTPDKSDEKP